MCIGVSTILNSDGFARALLKPSLQGMCTLVTKQKLVSERAG